MNAKQKLDLIETSLNIQFQIERLNVIVRGEGSEFQRPLISGEIKDLIGELNANNYHLLHAIKMTEHK